MGNRGVREGAECEFVGEEVISRRAQQAEALCDAVSISQRQSRDMIRRVVVEACELGDSSLRLGETCACGVLEGSADWQDWCLVARGNERVGGRAGTTCAPGRHRVFLVDGGDVEGKALDGVERRMGIA